MAGLDERYEGPQDRRAEYEGMSQQELVAELLARDAQLSEKGVEIEELTSVAGLLHSISEDFENQNQDLDSELRYDPDTETLSKRELRYVHGPLRARAVRLGETAIKPTLVLMADVDDFKSANDILTHAGGDQRLKDIAAVLKSKVRKNDAVGRWGGDEFMIFLDSATTEEGLMVADRMIEGAIALTPTTEPPVETSLTVAVAEVVDEDFDAMTERISAALLKAKQEFKGHAVLLPRE